MIDEALQDLAVAYVLGELKGAEGIRFLKMLDSDAELRALVRELEEGLGDLARIAAPVAPRAAVFERLFKEIRSQKIVQFPILPWSLAAALAVGCGLLTLEIKTLRKREAAALQQARQKSEQGKKEVAALRSKLAEAKGENRRLAEVAESYRKKSDLSEMKIATLNAQVQSYANALAVVVWDAKKQEGLANLSKLPKLEAGKDYQLWVLDPSYKQPVSAGIVAPDANGFTRTVFKPAQEIRGAEHFAVSIEKAGGSAAPQGQIVLVGQ